MRLHLNLTPKVAGAFWLFAVVLLAVVGGFAYLSGRHWLRTATISELVATAHEKEAALDRWMKERQANVASLAASTDVRDGVAALSAVAPGSRAARLARDRLMSWLPPWKEHGGFLGFLGMQVMAADSNRVIAANDHTEEGKAQAMTVSAPVRAADGRLLGVLAGRIDPDGLGALVTQRTGLYQTDDAFVVNASRFPVTRPRFLPEAAAFQRFIHTEAINRCLAGKSGVVAARDYGGVPAFFAYRWVAEHRLCLVVKRHQAEALALTHSFGLTMLAISGSALLAAAALAYGLALSITRPVRELQAAAVRFSKGELDVRLPETSGDELGRLAREFNAMAAALSEKEAALRSYAQDLERLVEERTTAVRRSEARLAGILDIAPDAIISVDEAHQIVLFNQGAEKVFGYPAQQVLGQPLDLLLPPRFAAAQRQYIRDFAAAPETSRRMGERREILGRRRDGTEFPTEASISKLAQDGRIIFTVMSRDITERKRAEEEIRALNEENVQRRQVAESLANVAHLLSETLDLDLVAQRIVDNLRELLNAHVCHLFRLEPKSGDLVALAVSGEVTPGLSPGDRLRPDASIAGLAMSTRQPAMTPNLLADPRITHEPKLRARLERASYRSLLVVPLLVQDRAIGTVGVGDLEGRVFADEEVRLAQAFADHAAVAMENARLFTAQREETEIAQTLVMLAEAVGQLQDPDEVLEQAALMTPGPLGATRCGLFLCDPNADILVPAKASGLSEELLPKFRSLAGPLLPVAADVRTTGEPAVLDQRAVETALSPTLASTFNIRSLLAIPLMAEDRMVGFMTVDTPGEALAFSPKLLAVARGIAAHAALAIDRARLFQDLARSEERLRHVLATSPTVIYALASEAGALALVWMSDNISRIMGYEVQEALQPHWWAEHLHPEDRERVLASLSTLLKRGHFAMEYRFRHRDGTYRWVHDELRTFQDAAGETREAIGSWVDITERRQTEEALRHSEKLAAMGSLLAGVAHELNNPLAVVLGQAALLRRTTAEGPVAERAQKIAQAAERCSRIVRNFLALARQSPPERQQVSLNQVVKEALELLAYPLRVGDVQVTLDMAPEMPVLWADPHQLHQVVVNLLSNAHQALRESHSPRQITIATETEPEHRRIRLRVTDTGPGIPPELQARIFEPFFTTKPPGQGTGLGLSLCQGIVESHGGTIRVESEPGQGATFVIELPAEAPPSTGEEGAEAEAIPLIRGKRILVVDDEPQIAAIVAEVVSSDRHLVETATGGGHALRLLLEQPFDLIVSDIKMPGLDGPMLYQELERSRPELCRRIVFLTGDTLNPETAEFLHRTRAPSLAKPFALEDLRRVVQRALRIDG